MLDIICKTVHTQVNNVIRRGEHSYSFRQLVWGVQSISSGAELNLDLVLILTIVRVLQALVILRLLVGAGRFFVLLVQP